jgi:hypothetical protein
MMRGAGLTETATCEAATRSGAGCKNAALPGDRWCHGHHPDRAQARVLIASAGGRARSRPTTEDAFSVGEEEQAARDKAVVQENFRAAALDTLIATRSRQVRDDPPLPDLQRSRDALRDARTRQAWAEYREQAERHRATLTDLICHHESSAARLEGEM